MDQASELFKMSEDHALVNALRQGGIQGDSSQVSILAGKFEDHTEQILEVCPG